MKVRYLLTSIWLGAATLLATFGPVLAGCNLELSAGVGVTDDKLSSGSTIDLNQFGGLLGAGAGCDLAAPQTGPVLGVLARYSVMHVVGDLGTDSLTSDRLWEAAARLGWKYHNDILPYALVGWAGMNLGLPSGIGDKSPNGPMAGLGIEARITGAWWMRGEYDHYFFEKQDIGSGASITPNLNVIRAALVLKFDDVAARPLK
jgi:opacity protein-like surface antigen